MNIYYNYFEKRASVIGISILEKLANIRIYNPALKGAISSAANKDFAGAAGTLLTNRKAREEALTVAKNLKKSGKLDNVPELKEAVPEKMPGIFGLPKLSTKVLSTIAKNKGNPSFKNELRNILSQLEAA